jgi:ADP-ribose pyrophosphatase YjhB (NUDIX family)
MLTIVTDRKFRDSKGRRLTDYPRPSVAVDTALLTPDPDEGLLVLEVKRENTSGWGVPGTFLWEGERLADGVRRSLRVKAGVEGVEPHQLQVFEDPDRDDRGWVLSVAHWAVVPVDRLDSRFPQTTRLMPVDNPGRLIYDHRLIIDSAVAHLRSRYEADPDPDRLLGNDFTVLELRRLHEVILGERLDPDIFRREMRDKLIPTGEMSEGTRGRPAELFRRRARSEPRPRSRR